MAVGQQLPSKAVAAGKPLHQGRLLKKHPARRGKWVARWCVIAGDMLAYYADQDCQDKKGEVHLGKGTKVMPLVGAPETCEGKAHGKERPNSILILACKDYYFDATTPAAMTTWIQAMEKAIATSTAPVETCSMMGAPLKRASKPKIIRAMPVARPLLRANAPTRASIARRASRNEWVIGDPERWHFDEEEGYVIQLATSNTVQPVEFECKDAAIEELMSAPHQYFGCQWVREPYVGPARLFPRACTFYQSGFGPAQAQQDAWAAMKARYAALPKLEDIESGDTFTEGCLSHYRGRSLVPRSPGRGQGVADRPGLKIIGSIDPKDIKQGIVGDCWLLCAISALAEFDGAVEHLFRKNPDLESRPSDDFNMYTVTLYDMPTWEAVDVVVDERLLIDEERDAPVGCKPTSAGELWPCILEKAYAAHCGGWEKVDGGLPTHAWRILLGVREVYTFMNQDGEGFSCFGTYNPNEERWEELANCLQESAFQGTWPMKWPEVGGGGHYNTVLGYDDMFERMCLFEDNNFIMSCGSYGVDDTQRGEDGIVQGHAYTILQLINDAGGTQFDMIKLRNPWGHGEAYCGDWVDGGANWELYPEVFEACGRPQVRDDGIFWMQKEHFFRYFTTVYVCAHDMSKLKAES